MKIIKLTAENVKKLRAVEIVPDGEVVTISGRNGAGKSSVLDSIWWALAGTSHIQTAPIRKGEKKARIRLDLGELVVERRFAESGSTLTVESQKGARYPSPQKMLDALLGALSFDPLAFERMKPRDQFDELRRIAELDIDIDELDRISKGEFDKRTDVNRDAKAKRVQADAITVPDGLPAAPVDESALLDEIQKAGETNAQIETRKLRRQEARADADRKVTDANALRERAALLRKQADELDAQAATAVEAAKTIDKKLDEAPPLPGPVDVTEIRAKLDAAKQTNAGIAKRELRAKIVSEAEAFEKRSAELTESMEARARVKADAIARAKMPVPGLGFGDGAVLYNGVPFEQASSAERLQVSLAIAMAANPKLRVIRIQDGSLLDEDSLARIADMAKAGDYQVWIERVDTSGKIGITIEDGAVVAVDGKPIAQGEAA